MKESYMSEQLSLSELAGWRGKTLVSSDGLEVGRIREVIYDYLTGEPVGLGVGERIVTLRVPASGSKPEGDLIRSEYSKEQIENQPPSDFGRGFSNWGEERHLYEYFGVSLRHEPELRVLLEGDDLPGQERVIGV
jgi:hypothetical protein